MPQIQIYSMKHLLFTVLLGIQMTAMAQGLKLSSAKSYLDEFNRENDYATLEKARNYIDQAIADPKTGIKSETWYVRGLIYQTSYDKPQSAAQKNVTDAQVAVESFEKAIELDPKFENRPNAVSYVKQAGFRFYNDGIDFFQKKEFVKSYETFEKTKAILQFLVKNGEALSYVNKDTKQTTEVTNADLDKNLMITARNAGMLDKAIEMLAKQNAAAPTAEGFVSLSSMYKEKGDKVKAREMIQAGNTAFPNDINLLILDIQTYLDEKKEDQAFDKIKKATELDPTNTVLLNLLGTTNEKMGKLDEAKLCFEKVISLAPDDYNANYNLGVNYNTRANEVIKRMNALGTSAADNKKYDLLKAEQIKIYTLAKSYFEKCEVISPGKEESVPRMIKAINAALSNK